MKIQINLSALRKTKWYEYAVRFFFGGAITVATGLIAKRYGPIFGGLFLAFPAIFPASATLVEKHEIQKKFRSGILKTSRGREAAALDARGAAFGSIGLCLFAFMIWKQLPAWNTILALFTAFTAWLSLSVLIWPLRKINLRRQHTE